MVSKIIHKGYMMFLVSQLVILLIGIIFCLTKLVTSVAECIVAVTKAYVRVKRVNSGTKEKRRYESNDD